MDSVSVHTESEEEEEEEEGKIEAEEDEDEEEDIMTPPPPKLELHHRRLRMSSFSPIQADTSVDVETHLDVRIEPLYADLGSLKMHSSNHRANAAAAVHWNASTLDRERTLES